MQYCSWKNGETIYGGARCTLNSGVFDRNVCLNTIFFVKIASFGCENMVNVNMKINNFYLCKTLIVHKQVKI